MKKNLFFVLQLCIDGKCNIAVAISQPANQNLYHYFDRFNNKERGVEVKVVHYCETWKKALELESVWNNGFKTNGTLWNGTF